MAVLLWACGSLPAADALKEARDLWQRGRYGEAFEKYSAIDGETVAVAIGKSRCLISEGKDDEAQKILKEALQKHPQDADLLAVVAEMDLAHGRWEEASSRAEEAIKLQQNHLSARLVRASLLASSGKFEEANREYEWFIHHYNEAQPKDPAALLVIAKASAEYARWNKLPDEFDFILNELLVDAAADESYWQAPWLAGTLLIEKYNKAEGVPELKKALEINPSCEEALVSLGVAALQDYDFTEGLKFADLALEINPNSVAALNLKADLLLTDSRTEAAELELNKARNINPRSEETLGKLAACYELKRKPEESAKLEQEVLERNSKPGVFYFNLADPLEKRRQFDVAEKHYKKAIACAPHLAGAWNGLGMLYMRIGKEDEARATFEEARKLDPFHVRVLNFSKVLSHLEPYKRIESEHYEVIYREDKDALLARYMSQFLEKKHPELCKRFGFETPERTKIEIMVDHQWFSARVVGLPSIGTVGACTGKVVAIASPRSLRTPYNWARVLTHEVTHIITLRQTEFNIPHWYTEALAVLSEGYPRSAVWNQLLAERVPKRDLFNLDTVNHAFVRPKTPLDWQMAYCQSMLYAEYMMAKFGDDSLAKLLDAYRVGMETDDAVPRVFGVSKVEFEKGYLEYLDGIAKTIVTGPSKAERSFAEAERAYQEDPDNPERAAELAEHHLQRKSPVRARELAEKALAADPKQPLALYVLARMEYGIGKTDEALKILEPGFDPANPNERLLDLLAAIRMRQKDPAKAAELYEIGRKAFPLENKWVEGLARVYLQTKEEGKLRPVLETLARTDSDNINVRKKLLEITSAAEEWPAAEQWAWEVIHVDVADPLAHRVLGDVALTQKKYPLAIEEYQVHLSLARSQEPGVQVKLAEARLGNGEKDKAKEILRAVLEADPQHARAKELLEQAEAP
ncbi:MAG: tetratricopeptide repeat protein [Planctomycetota bacterium]